MTVQPLRFLVSVDEHWRVTFSCPALELSGPSRVMRQLPDAEGGIFPLAPTAELAGPEDDRLECCVLYCCTQDAAVLTEGRQRIIDRNLDPALGTSRFGGYLFHTLIGAAAWKWIRDVASAKHTRCIELALSWANGDANLNRLNWEMMHDGRGFLAAGLPGVTVAITRLVAGTEGDRWEPKQVDFPPRILFVVGTTLNDPSIRRRPSSSACYGSCGIAAGGSAPACSRTPGPKTWSESSAASVPMSSTSSVTATGIGSAAAATSSSPPMSRTATGPGMPTSSTRP